MASDPTFWLWLNMEHLEMSKLKNAMLAIPLQTGHLIPWHVDSFYYKNCVIVVKDKEGQISLYVLCNWSLLFLPPGVPFTLLLVIETQNFWGSTFLSVSVPILQLKIHPSSGLEVRNVGLSWAEHHIPLSKMVGLDLPQDLIRASETWQDKFRRIMQRWNKRNQILSTLSTWSQTTPGVSNYRTQ